MDELQIRNLVLSKLGEEEQLDDPAADTRANRAISANWSGVRDQVLRMHLWNFAIDPAGTELVPDGAFTPSALADYRYRYALPADFIRLDMERLRPRRVRHDMRLGGGFLYSNDGGAILLVYVRQEERVGLWDDLFAEVFACHMAGQIGRRIVGQDFDRAAMVSQMRLALANAKAVDGRENGADDFVEPEWITARFVGGGGRISGGW
ncbi:MAG: hypothetical protein ACK4IS_13345 [Erythrobacter sp.]